MMDVQSEDGRIDLIGAPVTHAGTVTPLGAGARAFRFETTSHDGANAVSFSLDIPVLANQQDRRVMVDIEVETGAIGIGCMRRDYSEFVNAERVVSAGPRQKVYVATGTPGRAGHLMLRNVNHEGASVARVYGIDLVTHSIDRDELFADLDDLGRATASDAPMPFLFCVVSWGAAATQWLAATLNAHPDIYCVHCANQFWERLGGARRLDGWEYLRILGSESPVVRACGDVHGVSREAIPDLRNKLGRNFNCAVLVREPLPRLRSQMAHFENWPVKSAWKVDYVQKFIEDGVRLPQDDIMNRLFLHGVNMLNNVILEEPVAPLWRSEDLTGSPAALSRFVEELTRGNVDVNRDWAERAVNRPASNRHRLSDTSAHAFEPWQCEAIRRIVSPEAWQIYESLGYKSPDFIG